MVTSIQGWQIEGSRTLRVGRQGADLGAVDSHDVTGVRLEVLAGHGIPVGGELSLTVCRSAQVLSQGVHAHLQRLADVLAGFVGAEVLGDELEGVLGPLDDAVDTEVGVVRQRDGGPTVSHRDPLDLVVGKGVAGWISGPHQLGDVEVQLADRGLYAVGGEDLGGLLLVVLGGLVGRDETLEGLAVDEQATLGGVIGRSRDRLRVVDIGRLRQVNLVQALEGVLARVAVTFVNEQGVVSQGGDL